MCEDDSFGHPLCTLITCLFGENGSGNDSMLRA